MAEPPLRYRNAGSRRQRIVHHVRETGFTAASALARELGVHEMTIRRDLHRLAEEGLVRLVHGGAGLPTGTTLGSPYGQRAGSSPAAKAAIGAAAHRFLSPGMTLGLDSGTTVTELARRLPQHTELTVVTHSLTAMAELADRADIVLIGLGGLYHQTTRSFADVDTRDRLRALSLDVTFLSATALGPDGVYCASPFEAESKRAMLAAARQTVLLTDASKTVRTAPVRVCGLERIDALVTDARLRPADRRWLGRAVREVLVVAEQPPQPEATGVDRVGSGPGVPASAAGSGTPPRRP